MTWSAFLLLAILVELDMQNVASAFGRVIRLGAEMDEDFTIVVPIFRDPCYFRNGDYLAQYRDQTLLAVNVDSPKMERFAEELVAADWRVHVSRLTGRMSCPEVVYDALQSVRTTYVIRMDGDTMSYEHPGRAVAAVRREGAHLCSVKVTVSRRVTLIEKLQAVEYDMAMLGRPVPADVRLHGLHRLAPLDREVERAVRRPPRRRDPAIRRAHLHRRLLRRELAPCGVAP